MAYFRQRGDTWSFTVDVGRDQKTGKRKQKTVSGFTSEKEAIKACNRLQLDLEDGKRIESITLVDFIKMYFETKVVNNVEETTYISQWIIVEKYIIPRLGWKKIDKITSEDLDIFYSDLLKNGVSRGYIKNISLVLSKTFRQATIWNYIIKNVAREVSPPQYKPDERQVWTEEQLSFFLEESRGFARHALYVLASTSGMRNGEMLALHWTDIDFNKCTVSITKTLKFTKEKGLHIKLSPKTDNSRRTIKLPQSTIDTLLDHKARQLPDVPIIFDQKCKYTYPTEALRKFVDDSSKLNMPRITLHDLRHTHATLLLQWGYNAKVVSERLGDSVEMVMRTYAHVLPSMQDDVAVSLNRIYTNKSVDNFENVVKSVNEDLQS